MHLISPLLWLGRLRYSSLWVRAPAWSPLTHNPSQIAQGLQSPSVLQSHLFCFSVWSRPALLTSSLLFLPFLPCGSVRWDHYPSPATFARPHAPCQSRVGCWSAPNHLHSGTQIPSQTLPASVEVGKEQGGLRFLVKPVPRRDMHHFCTYLNVQSQHINFS